MNSMRKKSFWVIFGTTFLRAFLGCGQTMWRVGIIGALTMSSAFIGVSISIIVNEGFGAFSSTKDVAALVSVFFIVVLMLIVAWGRIRILLGREPVEMPFRNHGIRLVLFLNAMGVISLILIPMVVLGFFTGVYDKQWCSVMCLLSKTRAIHRCKPLFFKEPRSMRRKIKDLSTINEIRNPVSYTHLTLPTKA